MILGENVFLRPIEVTDLQLLVKWRNDEELAKYTLPGIPYPMSLGKQREWFDQLQEDSSVKALLICLCEGEIPIGRVSIHNMDSRNMTGFVAIAIGEPVYWGHGYGTEAMHLFLRYCFRVLNLRRIVLEVYAYNERAVRSYEKVGFVKEGKVRRNIFKDGQYMDEYVMAIFKDNYLASHPEPFRK